jgi:hypothetical protein
MSSSSISASEGRAPRPRIARHIAGYLAAIGTLVVLAVPAFLGLVALGHGLTLDMAYDKVALRLTEKMALAETREGRRILVFSGSSGFFDFRAADVEAATGLATVNLATHSGNGLAFLLWQAETVARPGDIVILPLEDGYYSEPGVTYYGANVSLAMGAGFFDDLPLQDKLVYLRNIHIRRLLKVAVARLGIGTYELEPGWTLPINANGDMEAQTPDPAALAALIAEVSGQRANGFTFVPPAFERIRDFVARMRQRNVAVVFTLPGIMETAAPTEAQVAALAYRIDQAGATFLPLRQNGAIPAEMMFDTIYHAAVPGARVYTAQVILALCERGDELGFACSSEAINAAETLLVRAAERGYLIAADAELAAIGPLGEKLFAALEAGRTYRFSLARLRGCRDELVIRANGTGTLDIAIAGKPVAPLIAPGPLAEVRRQLTGAPGLVPVQITVREGAQLHLATVLRESSCKG